MLFELRPFVALYLLAWLWTTMEPVQKPIGNTFKGKTLVGHWIGQLLSCWKCVTLWSGLCWFGVEAWFEVVLTAFVVFVSEVFLSRWQRV